MSKLTRRRAGVILLESLVALTLVSIGALATLVLSRADSENAARVLLRSKEMQTASDFLEAATLWTRNELDSRLGTRQQGPYRLRILRPEPSLYTLELLDAAHNRRLLVTAVFRPEDSRAEH